VEKILMDCKTIPAIEVIPPARFRAHYDSVPAARDRTVERNPGTGPHIGQDMRSTLERRPRYAAHGIGGIELPPPPVPGIDAGTGVHRHRHQRVLGGRRLFRGSLTYLPFFWNMR
jgi:hypothetical protein